MKHLGQEEIEAWRGGGDNFQTLKMILEQNATGKG